MDNSMVRFLLKGEVGSASSQALRIAMQSDKKRNRSYFCKCVSRLDARQVPWHRQGPEEVILESEVLMFLWSSFISLNLTSLMSITIFFSSVWWVCGEPWKVLYGSIMHMLVHTIMPLDDPDDNLEELWSHVSRLYTTLKIPYKFSSLKMTMFSTKGGNSDS